MKILVAVVVAMMICGCSASKWSTQDKVWLGTMWGCNAADVITTRIAINRGGEESNPIYGTNPGKFRLVGIKAAAGTVLTVAADRILQHRKKLLAAGSAINCGVAIWNINVGR